MRKKRELTKEYALYKGDKFIDLGTTEYLANKLNVDIRTIYYYSTPRYQKIGKENGNKYILIKIEDDDIEW